MTAINELNAPAEESFVDVAMSTSTPKHKFAYPPGHVTVHTHRAKQTASALCAFKTASRLLDEPHTVRVSPDVHGKDAGAGSTLPVPSDDAMVRHHFNVVHILSQLKIQ